MSDDDRAGDLGPIYLPALQRIRDLWLDLEPLVDATAYDDVVAPTELQISLSDGLADAESARLDIQWSELGMYSFQSRRVSPAYTTKITHFKTGFSLMREHLTWDNWTWQGSCLDRRFGDNWSWDELVRVRVTVS